MTRRWTDNDFDEAGGHYAIIDGSSGCKARWSDAYGAKHPHIQVWATTAKDLVSATASVGTLVESEVTHFVPAATTAAVIAGAPAVVLVGSGEEADDGDPSAAEVTLFTVQGVVYVLVNHAEGDGAAKHHDVVAGLLETLRPGL